MTDPDGRRSRLLKMVEAADPRMPVQQLLNSLPTWAYYDLLREVLPAMAGELQRLLRQRGRQSDQRQGSKGANSGSS